MTPAPKNLREALERVRALCVGERYAWKREQIDSLGPVVDGPVDGFAKVADYHTDPHGDQCGWTASGALDAGDGLHRKCHISAYGDLCGSGINFVDGPWTHCLHHPDRPLFGLAEAQP